MPGPEISEKRPAYVLLVAIIIVVQMTRDHTPHGRSLTACRRAAVADAGVKKRKPFLGEKEVFLDILMLQGPPLARISAALSRPAHHAARNARASRHRSSSIYSQPQYNTDKDALSTLDPSWHLAGLYFASLLSFDFSGVTGDTSG